MILPKEAFLLRIFCGENDKYEGKPLYEVIVRKSRDMGMAGATVIHGFMGFGAASRIHTSKILRLSEDLPILIEIVDKEERIQAFLPILENMMSSGLTTIERVEIINYGPNKARE